MPLIGGQPVSIELFVDGEAIAVDDDQANLLDVLRDQCSKTSVKDGCAPQGQCGCCTVLVDGQARVACVTPVRRIAGRSVTTLDGLDDTIREGWAEAFVATGGSQCGFCTPGIICRLEAVRRSCAQGETPSLDNPLAAHLCRCTGWQTIVEAHSAFGSTRDVDPDRAAQRASIEGRTPQRVGTDVVCGAGGFAADTVPANALVAVPGPGGDWVVAESLAGARAAAGKVQGRRTTIEARPPIPVPDGDWVRTLQTGWVEPAALETETTWCEPGGEPASLIANGGAFGAKLDVDLGAVARRLADESGRVVKVVLSREDSVRMGAKRPPLAAGVRADGTGVVVVAATPGIDGVISAFAPGLEVHQVNLPGPPTSASIRAAGWAEAAVLLSSLRDEDEITTPEGAVVSARVSDDRINLIVDAGAPLDEVILRSYCIGAAHMAYSWVTSEGIAVDTDGVVHDLTIRSFGIVRAADMPPVDVEMVESAAPPVNGSDAVFAAVAAATWRWLGFPPAWPAG